MTNNKEQYINKSALIAELEKRIEEGENVAKELPSSAIMGLTQAYKNVLSFLDTLEVKEVDYERELSKYVSNGIHRFFPNVDDDYCKMDSVIWQDYVIETAKHFYELGMQQSKK